MSESKVLRIAVHAYSYQARRLLDEDKADFVILIYSFGYGDLLFTHIFCRDEEIMKKVQGFFPDSTLNPRIPGDYYVLLVKGKVGEEVRDQLLDLLPEDDSWSYEDFR